MTKLPFDDETLMAFADGELDAVTTALIEKAMNENEQLAERVAMFMETRELAKTSMAPLLEEPVPPILQTNIENLLSGATKHDTARQTGSVQLNSPANENKSFALRKWVTPLAASVTLIAGGIVGFYLGQSDAPISGDGLQFAEFNQPSLVGALQSVASGEEITLAESGDRFRAIASYRDVDNTFCREFEVDQSDRDTFVSVACWSDHSWKVKFTVAAASQSADGYAPASSLDALEAYLSAVGASEVLSVEEETQILKAKINSTSVE